MTVQSSPVSADARVPGLRKATRAKEPPLIARSTMKPLSLLEPSTQARSIWVAVTGRRARPVGGAGMPGPVVVAVTAADGGDAPAALRARARKTYVRNG